MTRLVNRDRALPIDRGNSMRDPEEAFLTITVCTVPLGKVTNQPLNEVLIGLEDDGANCLGFFTSCTNGVLEFTGRYKLGKYAIHSPSWPDQTTYSLLPATEQIELFRSSVTLIMPKVEMYTTACHALNPEDLDPELTTFYFTQERDPLVPASLLVYIDKEGNVLKDIRLFMATDEGDEPFYPIDESMNPVEFITHILREEMEKQRIPTLT
jgi:hypothetical protein